MRNKSKKLEEEAENSPKEVKSQKKKSYRQAARKPQKKDFLQSNISSLQSRRSSIMPQPKDRSNSMQKEADKLLLPSTRLSMRRASLQPIAIRRLQVPKSQIDHSNSIDQLVEDKSLKLKSINESKRISKIHKSVDEEVEKEDNSKDEVDKCKEENKKLSGHALLINLMKQNVGEVKLSPEQKALHEAYHTLIDEYERRKKLRQKTGVVFKRARNKIREMIRVKSAWTAGAEGKDVFKGLKSHKESDLELKSRSQFLQKRKVAIKKTKGQHHNVVNYNDADRV